MGRAESVIFALGPLGEARQAAALAQGAHPVAASGQDLVRIGLMAHVPNQDIARRLEHMVQGNGQLNHAEASAQMAAGGGHGVNHLGPNLIGQLTKLAKRHAPRVRRHGHSVEKRRVGNHDAFGLRVRSLQKIESHTDGQERRSSTKSTLSFRNLARLPKGARWARA